MLSFTILAPLLAVLFASSTEAQVIAQLNSPPAGYESGFSTQDGEPAGQQSICNTNCPGLLQGGTTSGPVNGLAPGVFAAAINPQMGGSSSDCTPCGHCYSIINSGSPLCNWTEASSCPVGSRTGSSQQTGPSEIKIQIVNHCEDCNLDGWFDINDAPSGWNNPKIYWRKLDDSECQ